MDNNTSLFFEAWKCQSPLFVIAWKKATNAIKKQQKGPTKLK